MEDLKSKRTSYLKILDDHAELIRKEITSLEKDLNAVLRLKDRVLSDLDTAEKSNKIVGQMRRQIDTLYDSQWSWVDKVWHVINELEEGFASDVADDIHGREPETDFKRCSDRATYFLSQFYREGKLIAKTYGKKYKYFIKKDPVETPA